MSEYVAMTLISIARYTIAAFLTWIAFEGYKTGNDGWGWFLFAAIYFGSFDVKWE